MASGTSLEETAQHVHRRDASQWSRVWRWFIRYMVQQHRHLILHSLPLFADSFASYNDAIIKNSLFTLRHHMQQIWSVNRLAPHQACHSNHDAPWQTNRQSIEHMFSLLKMKWDILQKLKLDARHDTDKLVPLVACLLMNAYVCLNYELVASSLTVLFPKLWGFQQDFIVDVQYMYFCACVRGGVCVWQCDSVTQWPSVWMCVCVSVCVSGLEHTLHVYQWNIEWES